jgi:RecA-family ATPase
VHSSFPENAAVSGRDILHGRVIVADFDGQEHFCWHIEPTAILRRENDPNYYWAIWRINDVNYTPWHIPGIHRQIIQYYGCDPAVCDRARIIRLAGFYSHKREEKTRYIFVEKSSKATMLDDHKVILPEIKRKLISEGDWDSEDYVSEKRLRFLLKTINPECDRHIWIGILGAIKDAKIGRDDFTFMEPFDKCEIADEWSSGALGNFEPANYKDFEDVTNTLNSLTRDAGGHCSSIGSLVHAAKEAGMDEVAHQRLLKVEPFTHPDKLPNKKDHNPEGENNNQNINECPDPLPMQNFAQLLAKEPQPVAEIIPDRIEKGVVNFLSGPGGSHKSRLALQYCFCIGAQIPIFGKMPAEVTPVYVGAEDDEAEIIRRMHKLAKRLDVHPDAVRETTGYLNRYNLDNALVRMNERGSYELTPFYDQLVNHVTYLPGHKFVVLDSCYDFVRFEGNAKVNEDVVNTFVKEVLGGFCRDTNSTLLVPWHPSYSGQLRGDGSGWSVAWHNSPRVRDQIKRKDNTDAFELTAEKRNHGALPQPITLHYSEGALLPSADIKLSEQIEADRKAIIAVAIQMAERGIPIQQQKKIGMTELDLLREQFECHARNKEVKDILTRAVAYGHLQYVHGSKYRRAGYYPLDAGKELAKEAKTRQKLSKNLGQSQGQNPGKTGKNRG